MIAALTVLEVDLVPLAVAGGAVLLVLGIVQLILGLKAQNSPSPTGAGAMVGETGVVARTQAFRHRLLVEIRGELWWAVPEPPGESLSRGDAVEVVALDRDTMILKVRRARV